MAFLRNLLSTVVGLFVFSTLIFFIFVGIAASVSTETVPKIKSNSILYFSMEGIMKEKTTKDPIKQVMRNFQTEYSVYEVVNAIKQAQYDDRIKGIYLKPNHLSSGYASFQEIRDAIVAFKTSGKFVYAYGEYISESDYYVASVADSLFLNPTGFLEFNGLSANITFYKGLLDKLEIKPEIFRVGKFKSFVEPFIRNNLSEENKLQYSELVHSIHHTYLDNVSQSTGISVSELKDISEQMKVSLPQDAMDYGLVDKVGYEDELKSIMKSKIAIKQSKKLPLVNILQYQKIVDAEQEYSKNKIAVIVAEGSILMGGDEGIVGSIYAKEIRKARENKSIKAIVLKINSGGGSLTASDMIWRELMLTKGKKPIIASMSDVAASGGYYIAMAADTIIAQPNTITGSIGIFGMFFNFTDFLENKIGITHEVVKTGDFSDIYTVTRPLQEKDRMIIQRGVNEGYNTFISKVAKSRRMSVEEIKEIAEGRVWTGTQAHENGLIDILGNFEDAITLAAEQAGISDDYALRYYPKEQPLIEKIIDEMFAIAKINLWGTDFNHPIKTLKEYQGIQARMAGEVKVK